jgi:cytochrome P450
MSFPSSLLDPEVAVNPYPFYQRLRTEDPVYWDEKMQVWVISRYADVVALAHDPRMSGIPPQNPTGEPRHQVLQKLTNNLVMFTDQPDHTRLRGLMEKAFNPRVDGVRERVQQVADSLIDAVADRGRMEVMRDLAVPLPLTVQSEFIGVPMSDSMQLTQWQAGLADFVFFTSFTPSTKENDRRTLQNLLALTDYFRPLIEQRRKEPKDDLITALVYAEEEGDYLSQQEALISSIVLTMGSFLSITVALANCVLGLCRNPDQMQKLQDQPALLESAVEELLRYESQVQFSPRRANKDFEMHGQLIRKDQIVIVGLGSSNRDESRFSNPDQLDITRADNRHLAFGYGPHGCIAARLARLHLRIAISTLMRRLKELHLETDDLVWNGAPMFRSIESLPVTFAMK